MNREYNKPLIDRNMKTCSETYQFEKDLKWENACIVELKLQC